MDQNQPISPCNGDAISASVRIMARSLQHRRVAWMHDFRDSPTRRSSHSTNPEVERRRPRRGTALYKRRPISAFSRSISLYVKYYVFQFGDLAEICENRDKIHRPKKVLFFRQSIVFIVKIDPFFIIICRKDPFCRIWNIGIPSWPL